jgi:crotonobetainyl-CoA:carnitine CoA-transferase CaiB-like acyl-CoA transferase
MGADVIKVETPRPATTYLAAPQEGNPRDFWSTIGTRRIAVNMKAPEGVKSSAGWQATPMC